MHEARGRGASTCLHSHESAFQVSLSLGRRKNCGGGGGFGNDADNTVRYTFSSSTSFVVERSLLYPEVDSHRGERGRLVAKWARVEAVEINPQTSTVEVDHIQPYCSTITNKTAFFN